MRRVVFVLMLAAALNGPGYGQDNDAAEDVPHAPATRTPEQQRIGSLEDFRRQQRDYNSQADRRLLNTLEDVRRDELSNAARLEELQKRLTDLEGARIAMNTAFAIFMVALSVGMPLFLAFDNRRHTAGKEARRAIEEKLEDLRDRIGTDFPAPRRDLRRGRDFKGD